MKVNDPFDRIYVGDWLRTFRGAAIRGVQDFYLNLRFIMHDSDRYGYLSMNGVPIPPASTAAMLGLSLEQYTTLLAELIPYAVLGRTKNGTLFDKQMVEMRCKSEVFSKAGRKGGGNPHLKREVYTSPDNDNDTSVGKRRPTSLNEVVERGKILSVSASECARFFNYHESKGWVVGKAPMRDWVAALRTWKSNQRKWEQEKSGEPPRKVFTPEQLRAMQEADA